MKNLNPLLLSILILILNACELTKEIDYDGAHYEPKLITHAYVNQQDGVQLIIKRCCAKAE